MPENTDEEHFDTPANIQSENPTNEIAPPKNTKTINTNQESKIMEVHHHPDLHHKPKKWKEYFLEFLMIFLAVTLGFFAESLRENLLEKERVHGYMKEMVENLKADTMRFHHVLNFNEGASPLLDSLRYEIDSAAMGRIKSNRLYFFAQATGKVSRVLFKQSAISELKASGSMRLVDDIHFSGKILDYYDRWLKATEYAGKDLEDALNELKQYEHNFFNGQYFETLIKTETTFSYDTDTSIINYMNRIKERNPPLVLLNNNPADLKKLNNKVIATETALHYYNSFVRLNLTLADSLILKIQKEYNLEN